jgi:5-methylcytosine-specific restriction endonuclease McrBC regulatory subunit McrC
MDDLEGFENRPALARIIKFCREILGNIQPFRTSERFGTGVAEFIDMERLWEHAIQLLLQIRPTRANEVVAMHPLRGRKIQLFFDGGPNLDPDIIIFRDDDTFAVVDAKYSSANSPSADDIYQLTCYVSRLNTKIGILAYVAIGEHSGIQHIGTLENGASLYACFVSLDAFDNRGVFLDNILGTYRSVAEVS